MLSYTETLLNFSAIFCLCFSLDDFYFPVFKFTNLSFAVHLSTDLFTSGVFCFVF